MLRLKPGPVFRNISSDFFTPANWKDYDTRVRRGIADAGACSCP